MTVNSNIVKIIEKLMYTKYYIKLLSYYIFDCKLYAFTLESEYSVGFLYNGTVIGITMKMNNDRREMMMISEAFPVSNNQFKVLFSLR